MKRFLSILLCSCLILSSATTMTRSVSAEDVANAAIKFNFTTTPISDGTNIVLENGSAPLYTSEKGYGFVAATAAMPSRNVDPSRIMSTDSGFVIEETINTTTYTSGNNYNYGGLVFRVDLQEAGTYALKVKTTSTGSNTCVAPSGMQGTRIKGTGAWDSSGLVLNNNPARWIDSNTWTYDYVTGRKYIEFEIEPASRPSSSTPITVGISGIEITKLDNNPVVGKPTVFVLGDSTEKTYTFEEAGMSGWGQIIASMFDLSKVNVINYSMGGRSFKSAYDEGRFNSLLLEGKPGDYVLLHSAHNDESTGTDAGPEARFGRGSNTTTYPKWLNEVYIPALKLKGMIPVLVTAMPRTSAGKYSEDAATKPNGFNPDSPGFMRQAAYADPSVEFIELYANAKAYIDKIGPEETAYMYMSLEAGESPGKTNSGSYANGHPDNKIDGTHYKEAASKQWCKIITDQICKQVAGGTTEYLNVGSRATSDNMKALKSYLKTDVQAASASGDWSAVFPEFAKDVTDTGTTNAYYKNQIEKLLQLGVMSKDSQGNFYPKNSMKTNEFISALCSLWKLDVNQFTKYYNSGDLSREVMASIIYDAYLLKFGKDSSGNWIKPDYMTKYNGSTISPSDPNYDPNLTGTEAQYYPLVGWGALADTKTISLEYAQKFYEVYNLGLMRSEKGIARGSMSNGTELEPKAIVTRDKAAKELWFLWVLSQTSVLAENQVLTVPAGSGRESVSYQAVNYTVPAYEFSSVNIDYNNNSQLSVSLNYTGTDTPSNKLVVDLYDTDGTTKLSTTKYDVTGSGAVTGLALSLKVGQKVIMYVIKSDSDTTKLSCDREVTCTKLTLPLKTYTAKTAAGIRNGTMAISNVTQSGSTASATTTTSATTTGDTGVSDAIWWIASQDVTTGDVLAGGMTLTATSTGASHTLAYSPISATIGGVSFTGRVASSSVNGAFTYSSTEGGYCYGSALKFIAPEDGIWSVYISNLGSTKQFAIVGTDSKSATDYLAKVDKGSSGNQVLSVSVAKGKTYYASVAGSKASFLGAVFVPGAPVVSTTALPGDTVKINATPKAGYHVDALSAVDANSNILQITNNSNKTEGTFVMPEANVTVNAVFSDGNASPSVPNAPSISAVAGNGTATIFWSQVSGATSYTVKGGTSSTVLNMVYRIDSPSVTSYTYSGLTNGTTYSFVVTASNTSGESQNSNLVTVTPTAGTNPSEPGVPSNIWIVGDSTVSSFSDSYYYPRYGWGTQIGNYINGSFTIQNIALSGRSSKSYIVEPQYQTLLSGMKSGDYLLVGFGHNDEKAEAERYTNPNGTYLDKGSFANSLYENYIKPAEAAGCKVILCTPIVRRTATGVWSDSNLHVTATSGDYAGGDYSQAIRTLGTTLNIPVVDLTSLTKSLYDQLGSAETLYLHAWTSSKADSVDNTHTNIWGAKYNAYLITKVIKELGVSGFAEYVINTEAPTKAANLVSNPDYKEPSYDGELKQSTLWQDYGIWKGTVMGDVGGAPSTTNQTLEKDSNGNMHIAVVNNKGKIASTVDGFAMYYYKIPASSTFTLTAKAKINKFELNNQVTFGLMARDAMYIDYNTKDALGDYVAAAPYGLSNPTGGSVWNCFARKSGVLTRGGTCTNPVAAGDIINLSIESNSDGYACTFGNESTVTGGFDFKLTSIDPNYVYVGMFVARNADITFSDIKLIVDGVEVTSADAAKPVWTDGAITAANVSQSGLTLNWSGASDNIGVTGYRVYKGTTLLDTVTGATYSVTGLTADTSYTFKVEAGDAAGNWSTNGPSIAATTLKDSVIVTPDTTAPTVPGNLKAVGVSKDSVILNWTGATDNVGVTGYIILKNGEQAGTSYSVTDSVYRATITGLKAETLYRFNVIACDMSENYSAQSNTVEVTTKANETPVSTPINTPSVTVAADGSNKNLAITQETVALSTKVNISIPACVSDAKLDVTGLLNTPINDTVTTHVFPAMTVSAATYLTTSPVQLTIPAGLTISAPAVSWNGIINMPSVMENTAVTIPSESGEKVTVNMVIEVGAGDVPLTLSKAVRILLPGKAGQKVGYQINGVFKQITTALSGDSQAIGDALPERGDGMINVGNDLVIWTKHFTKYVAYTETSTSSGRRGGAAAVSSTNGSAQVQPLAGGSISLGDDVKVVIPANAIKGSYLTSVSIQKAEKAPSLASGSKLLSPVYEITVDGKKNYEFNTKVTLTIKFDATAVENGMTPAIHYFDEATSSWVNIGGTISEGKITAEVDHITTFAVIVTEKKEENQSQSVKTNLEDVNGHWAATDINKLVASGVIAGYPDGNFKPDNNITRAEFVKILVSALNLQPKSGKIFTDTSSHWAKEFIETANAYGIVSGYDEKIFAPDDFITREQMVVMISKAIKLAQVNDEITFTDKASISDWAKSSIAAAKKYGIIDGYQDNSFKPSGNATRAEAVTVIVKAMGFVNK